MSWAQRDHEDDDIDMKTHTYSLQFLNSIGIQVHQASREMLVPSDYCLKHQWMTVRMYKVLQVQAKKKITALLRTVKLLQLWVEQHQEIVQGLQVPAPSNPIILSVTNIPFYICHCIYNCIIPSKDSTQVLEQLQEETS